MAITYSWKLTSLKKKNSGSLNGVVFQTYWQKTGTDENGNTGTFSGATPFDPAQIDANNFVAFDQLTEATVLGWIQSVVVDAYEQHVNEQIQRQIDEKVNASADVMAGSFPWDPPAAVVPDPAVPLAVPPTTTPPPAG